MRPLVYENKKKSTGKFLGFHIGILLNETSLSTSETLG